jgi:hypothetical protein
MTTMFVQCLQSHLDTLNAAADKGHRITAYKVALEVGLDPTYVTNIFRGRKNGTPETIRKLSCSKLLQLSYERLRSWQILNETEPEVLRACMDELNAIGTDPHATTEPLIAYADATLKPAQASPRLPVFVPFKWQLGVGGFTPVITQAHEGSYWSINHLPPDILPQLSSLYVADSLLWPPIPAGSLMLVRPIRPAHLLRADQWYIVQPQMQTKCVLVTYDPVAGCLRPMAANALPITLGIDTLQYAFEIMTYQVNLY